MLVKLRHNPQEGLFEAKRKWNIATAGLIHWSVGVSGKIFCGMDGVDIYGWSSAQFYNYQINTSVLNVLIVDCQLWPWAHSSKNTEPIVVASASLNFSRKEAADIKHMLDIFG